MRHMMAPGSRYDRWAETNRIVFHKMKKARHRGSTMMGSGSDRA